MLKALHTDCELSNTILRLAKDEDSFLRKNFDKGIFHMPELAFAYQAGRKIASSMHKHFGSIYYAWEREIVLQKNAGQTDLVFLSKTNNGLSYAIEFKLDDKYHKYTDDIHKLRALLDSENPKRTWNKYFCGLKRVLSEEQGTGFLNTLKAEFGTNAELVKYACFPTLIGNDSKQEFCLFTFWKIYN